MITVVGEALVDLVISLDGSVEAALGGAPYNTAIAAARLGAVVEFAGRLSDDRFGQLLVERLEADGVRLVANRTDRPTTLAAAEIDECGAASYRFYIDGTSAPALTTADVQFHTQEFDGAEAGDILFTGGLGLVLEPMADTVIELVGRRRRDTLVMVDVNCRPKVIDDRENYGERLERLLAHTDIVKVSDDDLTYLHPGDETTDAARRLLGHGVEAVLVTAGTSATSIVTNAGVVSVPVPPLERPVVDSIGAGDTFGGGFLAWWALSGLGRDDVEPENLQRAVVAAHAAAAVVVTRRGADPPYRADLPLDWL